MCGNHPHLAELLCQYVPNAMLSSVPLHLVAIAQRFRTSVAALFTAFLYDYTVLLLSTSGDLSGAAGDSTTLTCAVLQATQIQVLY